MIHYYIRNEVDIGYIVARVATDEDFIEGCYSCGFICNFGYRQSDAMAFRDDCKEGRIDPKRIKFLMDKYTDTPYKYMGKGILKKQ